MMLKDGFIWTLLDPLASSTDWCLFLTLKSYEMTSKVKKKILMQNRTIVYSIKSLVIILFYRSLLLICDN